MLVGCFFDLCRIIYMQNPVYTYTLNTYDLV